MDDKQLYELGMKALREHHEEVIARVMKSRSEDKGNFAYLEDADSRRERELAFVLEKFLYRLYAKFNNKLDNRGCCDKLCVECGAMRYNFNSTRTPTHWCNEKSEHWYCQYECECK